MKKTVSILLVIAMLLAGVLAIMSVNATEDVTRVPEKPTGKDVININNQEDYVNKINAGDTAGKVFSLNTDIYDAPLSDFKGTLYGNGHVFSTPTLGFENIEGATIKDLNIVATGSTVFGNIKGATIEGGSIEIRGNGTVASSVTDCTFKDIIVTVSVAGNSVFGSKISNSTLENIKVTVSGTKTINKSSDFGGMASNIENSYLKDVSCEYAIKVYGVKSYVGQIGGICTYASGETIFENVRHSGEIYVNTWGTSDDSLSEKVSIGGITAKTNTGANITYKDCVNEGNIMTTQTGANIGGILGCVRAADVTLRGCVNNGSLSSMVDTSAIHLGVGGMIGWTNNMSAEECEILISDCVNNGKIFETPLEDVFNAFCEIGAIEYNNEHKADADFVAVDAEGYRDIYFDEYIAEYVEKHLQEYLEKEEYKGLSKKAVREAAKKDDREKILEECINQTKFSSLNNFYAGGMVGRVFAISSLYINSCTNNADIIIKKASNSWGGTGGMVGSFVTIGNWEGITAADIRVINCENNGYIRGNQPAGIIGGRFMQLTSDTSKLVVEYCRNYGKIEGIESGRAAGIVCDFDGTSGDNACNMTDINIRNCANYGDITGATISGGIVASLCLNKTVVKSMSIINCYNEGNISTVNDMTTVVDEETLEESIELKEASMSGGIIATTALPVAITNCINAGTITAETAENAFPIVADDAMALATDNIHLGDGAFTYSAGKTQKEIDDAKSAISFEKINNTAYLEVLLDTAETLNEIDYTETTWTVFAAVLKAAQAIVQSPIAEQESIDSLEESLEVAMAGLEQVSVNIEEIDVAIARGIAYHKNDWDDFSFMNLTLAIKEAVRIRNQGNVLKSEFNYAIDAINTAIANLKERGESITLETVVDLTVGGLFDKDTGNNNSNSTGGAEQDTSDEGEGTDPTAQAGCGGIIGGAAVVIVAAAAVGVGVALKKKED